MVVLKVNIKNTKVNIYISVGWTTNSVREHKRVEEYKLSGVVSVWYDGIRKHRMEQEDFIFPTCQQHLFQRE